MFHSNACSTRLQHTPHISRVTLSPGTLTAGKREAEREGRWAGGRGVRRQV